jgi:hypothetical protein
MIYGNSTQYCGAFDCDISELSSGFVFRDHKNKKWFNLEPRFSVQLYSSHFGGFESRQVVMLFSNTFCKPSVVFGQ